MIECNICNFKYVVMSKLSFFELIITDIRDFYMCISNQCTYKNIPFCIECLKTLNTEMSIFGQPKKCPHCRIGKMEEVE